MVAVELEQNKPEPGVEQLPFLSIARADRLAALSAAATAHANANDHNATEKTARTDDHATTALVQPLVRLGRWRRHRRQEQSIAAHESHQLDVHVRERDECVDDGKPDKPTARNRKPVLFSFHPVILFTLLSLIDRLVWLRCLLPQQRLSYNRPRLRPSRLRSDTGIC